MKFAMAQVGDWIRFPNDDSVKDMVFLVGEKFIYNIGMPSNEYKLYDVEFHASADEDIEFVPRFIRDDKKGNKFDNSQEDKNILQGFLTNWEDVKVGSMVVINNNFGIKIDLSYCLIINNSTSYQALERIELEDTKRVTYIDKAILNWEESNEIL